MSCHDLLVSTVTIRTRRCEFQAIQGLFPTSGFPRSQPGRFSPGRVRLPDQHGQERVMAKVIVIVEIFIPEA